MEIKNSIKSIAKRYTYKQIAKALGSYAANLTKVVDNNNKLSFIELPSVPTVKSNLPTNKLNTFQACYTLQHYNGNKLIMEIPEYSKQQLADIIREFL